MEQLELELEFSNSKLSVPGGTLCALSPNPIMGAHKDSVNQNDATGESTFWTNSSNSTGLTMKSLHRGSCRMCSLCGYLLCLWKATSRGQHTLRNKQESPQFGRTAWRENRARTEILISSFK